MIELNTFMGLVAEPLAPPSGAPEVVAPVFAVGNGDPSSEFALTSDGLPPATAVAPLWMCLPALFIFSRRRFTRRSFCCLFLVCVALTVLICLYSPSTSYEK